MRNALLILFFVWGSSESIYAQNKVDESILFHLGMSADYNSDMLFPNPSIFGQDVYIESASPLGSDWWLTVRDSNGREIKGISAVQEGGRIRIHGQVPKPGIYIVIYGNKTFRSSFRWIIKE